MLSLRALAFILSLLFALGAFVACGEGGEPLPKAVFTSSDGDTADLKVEIADTTDARRQGLMFRERLDEDRGMLFDFGRETQGGFWMKDTSVPLSIAFISAEGVVLGIQDMEPFSTDFHTSTQPYRFAVEANRGWFERNDVGVGSGVRLPPSRAGGPGAD